MVFNSELDVVDVLVHSVSSDSQSCMCVQVTSERHCRAQREAVHTSHSYLCLLESTRRHLELHNQYHGKGERPPDEVARLVGLRLPTQPGGKGWEKWGTVWRRESRWRTRCQSETSSKSAVCVCADYLFCLQINKVYSDTLVLIVNLHMNVNKYSFCQTLCLKCPVSTQVHVFTLLMSSRVSSRLHTTLHPVRERVSERTTVRSSILFLFTVYFLH